jgi:hypothetical protein
VNIVSASHPAQAVGAQRFFHRYLRIFMVTKRARHYQESIVWNCFGPNLRKHLIWSNFSL